MTGIEVSFVLNSTSKKVAEEIVGLDKLGTLAKNLVMDYLRKNATVEQNDQMNGKEKKQDV